jgi:hypothetical protein
VVSETPQKTREQHFGLCLGSDLGTPFETVGTLDVVTDAETGLVLAHQRIRGLGRWRISRTADAPEQIPARRARVDPQLRADRGRERLARRHDNRPPAARNGGEGEYRYGRAGGAHRL